MQNSRKVSGNFQKTERSNLQPNPNASKRYSSLMRQKPNYGAISTAANARSTSSSTATHRMNNASHQQADPTYKQLQVPTLEKGPLNDSDYVDPKANKLDTMGGVTLPTILNVLSILMFLRFGFIIGQMGILVLLQQMVL
ncbi:unnamed protein product [Ambrosiozyma monospora]|uniref:Unnamed protein product n=1 Tax=Ambrosiozyma monospora TaxID=43982 RepID=A0ACB5UCR7_AMBMO|nr:unnamed protein product [Ambrosiozyma monospora]